VGGFAKWPDSHPGKLLFNSHKWLLQEVIVAFEVQMKKILVVHVGFCLFCDKNPMYLFYTAVKATLGVVRLNGMFNVYVVEKQIKCGCGFIFSSFKGLALRTKGCWN